MDKILITGGAGYIGSHMVHYLIREGYPAENIIVIDNLERGHKEFLPEFIHFIKGDLLDQSLLKYTFKTYQIDTVIHFAGYAYVGESIEEPGMYFRNNIICGLNILETMRQFQCKRIIFSSTCATYGIPNKTPITEESEQVPINPYGQSKLTFEKILPWYDTLFGIKSIILRYFNVGGADFGIGELHNPETHIIPLTLYAALGKISSVKVFGNDYETPDGTCMRDYLHITDLIDAHFKSMEFLRKTGESDTFNLGSGKAVSVNEIISIVKNIVKTDFSVITIERRQGDPAILIADASKAKAKLHWEPQKRIEDIINSAFEWYSTYFNKLLM